MEPVQFTGHQLRLLDLKRTIVEQKKMSSAMDFDLKITDAEDKNKGTVLDALYSPALTHEAPPLCFASPVYGGDDTFVPKNSSVVVKRVPVMGGGAGLLARLRGERPDRSR